MLLFQFYLISAFVSLLYAMYSIKQINAIVECDPNVSAIQIAALGIFTPILNTYMAAVFLVHMTKVSTFRSYVRAKYFSRYVKKLFNKQ